MADVLCMLSACDVQREFWGQMCWVLCPPVMCRGCFMGRCVMHVVRL